MPRFGQGPIYTGEETDELLDIPTWDMMKAAASQTFGTSPAISTGRAMGLGVQRGEIQQTSQSVARFGYLPDFNRRSEVKLTRKQADAKIDAAGLTGHLKVPDSGENEGALDLLIDYKTRELRNNFLLDRYRGGVAGGAVQLGTSLVTSMADPLNLLSAFVPVVGEARYAQILGRAGTSMVGRAGIRGGLGAVEGTVGAAVFEPLIYQSQQELQADYDTMDSLLNIGFGGIFGATLQPAAGALADVMARRAKVGAWAEALTSANEREIPELPENFTIGGGTRFIDGDDYGRGVFAIAEADTIQRPAGEGFISPDQSQLGESPYADSGAPVLKPDGSVANGNKRLAAVLDAYERGDADAYRTNLIESAARYGLDSDLVEGFASPVLVRVESGRDVGAYGEFKKQIENTPEARAEAAAVRPPPENLTVIATTKAGDFRLDDSGVPELAGMQAEGGWTREIKAFDDEGNEIGSLLYANDGTPPTVEVAESHRRQGVATAMLKLAKEQGGNLGDSSTGRTSDGLVSYRTDDGQAFRIGAREESVTLLPVQREAALKAGVAQAVNGDTVNPLAAAQLDGTPEGVARFLEEKRVAEQAEAAYLDKTDADAKRLLQEIARFDPADADKLDAEVKALEKSLRDEIKATGGDESLITAALEEADELAAELDVESKALRGVSLCMLRGG